MQLPLYQSRKYVHAAKIIAVNTDSNIVRLELLDNTFVDHEVSSEYMQKHNPQVGGYYVVYDSGGKDEYHSFSPGHVFEAGNRLMGPPPPGVEPTFTLRAQDTHAAGLVFQWANRARKHGTPEPKCLEAEQIARAMEAWPFHKTPD